MKLPVRHLGRLFIYEAVEISDLVNSSETEFFLVHNTDSSSYRCELLGIPWLTHSAPAGYIRLNL